MKTVDFVSGHLAKTAFESAKRIVFAQGQSVLAIINDIVIIVDENSNIDNLVQEYRKKLDFKYEIENIKRQKQK